MVEQPQFEFQPPPHGLLTALVKLLKFPVYQFSYLRNEGATASTSSIVKMYKNP